MVLCSCLLSQIAGWKKGVTKKSVFTPPFIFTLVVALLVVFAFVWLTSCLVPFHLSLRDSFSCFVEHICEDKVSLFLFIWECLDFSLLDIEFLADSVFLSALQICHPLNCFHHKKKKKKKGNMWKLFILSISCSYVLILSWCFEDSLLYLVINPFKILCPGMALWVYLNWGSLSVLDINIFHPNWGVFSH